MTISRESAYHRRMVLSRLLFASGLALGVIACADGTTVEDPATGNGGGGVGGLGGGGGAGGDDRGSSSKSASHAASSTNNVASTSVTSAGDGGGSTSSGDGGAGATSVASTSVTSTASTGMACNFTSPNDCATAESLGAIAGDEDNAPITVSGNTAKWYVIKIEERDSSIGGEDLSWRVNLVSPPGMNYDLVVHEGPQDGDVDCNGGQSTGTPDVSGETCYHSYDDDQGIGGEDDTLWLAIEVVYLSGEACTLSDVWTLTIEGHV